MTQRRYRLDVSNTFAAVIVRNDDSKLLSRLGHDHVVRADGFNSTVSIDVDHPENLNFGLSFAADSLVVDDPDDRRRVGFDPDVSDRDRKLTRDNMLAKNQLHSDRYANIDIAIEGARPGSNGEWLLNAGFTIRQKRFDFEFPVSIEIAPQLRASGRVEMTHSDLGLKPFRAPMGALRNRQELTFIIEIEAAPL